MKHCRYLNMENFCRKLKSPFKMKSELNEKLELYNRNVGDDDSLYIAEHFRFQHIIVNVKRVCFILFRLCSARIYTNEVQFSNVDFVSVIRIY